jgi:SAM-dependent methyltransferase
MLVTDTPPGFALAEPLDWPQLRALLWEAVDRYPPGTPARWDRMADYISARCEAEVNAANCEAVVGRLAVAYPDVRLDALGGGLRVWTRLVYESVHRLLAEQPVFMNLGYAVLAPDEQPTLDPGDEPYRLFAQMYHRLAAATDLAGRDVLDAGCGCGGGASYLSRYHHPRTVTGLDLVASNVAAAAAAYPDLVFVQGDACRMPFPDAAFDAVVSIEASHSFPSTEQFFAEVWRILRPGGTFLLADHRPRSDEWGVNRTAAAFARQLAAAGFTTVARHDITAQVVLSSEWQHDGKRAFLEACGVTGIDEAHLSEILHCRGSRTHAKLATGAWEYASYVLRRND